MFTLAATYLGVSLSILFLLSLMILRIGTLLGDCPQSGRAARAGAVTVATGFAAIGAGGIILIGSGLGIARSDPMNVLFACLGIATLCLGLGFTHAVTTLRAIVTEALADPAADPNPWGKTKDPVEAPA